MSGYDLMKAFNQFCWSQAAQYGLAQYKAEAAWARACLARLDTIQGE